MSIEQTDDLDATARILKRGADRGDADAQYMLAICYRDGDGAAQSPLQAARWFVAAADQGHAEAAYEAAMCLRSGVSGALPSGMQESAVYYQRDGVVTSKLETSAFDYFRFAAQQDHLESQFELGMCYVRGAGVAADSDAAREWLQRASAQGHARAMLSLLFGGFVCDALEKFRYCEIAALEGIADGQYELAVCYRDGIGTDIDIFTAKLWFGRASSQGHLAAALYLAELEEIERIAAEAAAANEAKAAEAAEASRKAALTAKAACVIQCSWRSKAARKIIKDKLNFRIKQALRKEEATRSVQCCWRSKTARIITQTRRQAVVEKRKIALRNNSVIVIQCAWRSSAARSLMKRKLFDRAERERKAAEAAAAAAAAAAIAEAATNSIQRSWRSRIARNVLREKRRLKEEQRRKEDEEAAVAAAAKVRQEAEEQERLFITSLMAMRAKPRFFAAIAAGSISIASEAASVMIQCAWRSRAARSLMKRKLFDRAERERKAAEAAAAAAAAAATAEAAANSIQRSWRSRVARNVLREKRRLKEERQKKEAALMAAAEARAVRMRRIEERKLITSLMILPVKLRHIAALSAGKPDIAVYAAASVIQAVWRSRIARNVLREKRRLKEEQRRKEDEEAAVAAAAKVRQEAEEQERLFITSLMAMRAKPRFFAAIAAGSISIASEAASVMIQCAWRSRAARSLIRRKLFDRAERERKAAEAAAASAAAEQMRIEAEKMFIMGLKLYNNGDVEKAVAHFRLAAERGHSLAQFNLGLRLVSGDGILKDLVEAVTWFRKAVESDHPGSQYMLAMCHLNGDGGVPYDIAKSESLLLRAAQQGHLDAMYELGIVYRGDHDRSESKAVQRLRDLVGEHSSSPRIDKYTDLNKSESWFRLGASHGHSGCQYECGMLSRQNKASADALCMFTLAAEKGHTDAIYALGMCYRDSDGVDEDPVKALSLFRQAANQGHSDAQFIIGYALQQNALEGDASLNVDAVKMYTLAAEQNHARAMYHLGICYRDGIGVPEEDLKRAAHYFISSGTAGYAAAQCEIGLCYADGDGVDRDTKEAARYDLCHARTEVKAINLFCPRWFQLASQQNLADGHYNLALCYFDGEGVRRKSSKAIRLMKLAVEQGHVDAMFSLAMYFRGDELTGVEKDTAQMTFYLKMAANSCMGKAQRMLGYLYKDGEDGTLKNRLLAMHYFRLAAEQGDKIASFELSALEEEEAEEKALQIKSMPAGAEELFSLGVKYREGEDGFERNNIEALRLFHLSAEQGHSRAIYFLACAYRDGDDVVQNYVEAARLFKLSAEKNHPESEYELAFCYYSGHGLPKDVPKAMTLFELCAIRGDARAEYVLALCHKSGGDGVEPSAERSFYYLQRAADHGDSDALFKLALCFHEGDGVTRNLGQAIHYFRMAAEQGDAEAAYRMYVANSDGDGVTCNPVEATKWLEIAAELGQVESQFQLGLRYRHGQGAARLPEVAVAWFKKSAEQQHAGAQCALALCYRDGFGVEKSAVEMVHYLKLAASQGHADATYALALCHRDGMGTAKDTVVARYFLQLSVDRGNTDAQDLLQALSP